MLVSENEQAAVTPPLQKECPADTVFDVTTQEDNSVPSGSHICLVKPGENRDATIIEPSGTIVTTDVIIDHSVGGNCPAPGAVHVLVDTGSPPDGFSINEIACTTIAPT